MRLYSAYGRDSIPPEKLLRAQLLMAFYTIRSERQLMEQIDYNLLFRWFVGFSMDDEVWDHSTFTKNRDRLLGGEVARRFFAQVLGQAERADLLSKEHFSVDGTMIEALASLKSYRPKDEDDPPEGGGRNRWVDFRGEKRSRDTHESKTDKDALLYKKSKGTAAKLSFLGHLLMENRHGLVVDAQVTQATGTAEREAAVDMVEALSGTHRVTLGADKNYDTRDCVDDLRCANVTPHVAQNTSNRSSAIDGRTTCHAGYADQPADPQADRGMLWLGEDHRWHAQEPVRRPREVGLSVCPDVRGLQPGSDAQSGGGGMLLMVVSRGWSAWNPGFQPKMPVRAVLGDVRSR